PIGLGSAGGAEIGAPTCGAADPVALIFGSLDDRRAGPSCLDPVGLCDEILRQRHNLHLLLRQPLNALEVSPLVLGAKGDGDAGRSCAGGAADAVDILL